MKVMEGIHLSNIYYNKPSLTHETAMKMLEEAVRRAQEMNIKVNIAIADEGGNLLAFVRMDGAPLLSSEIAQNKAYSAAAFGKPTSAWYPMIKDKPELLHGITHTNRLTIFSGGLPIVIDGALAGGIGVSGGTAEQDEECAESAVAFLANLLKRDGER